MSKILVVDDEVKACKLLKRFLEAKGHEAVTAGNGVEALEKLKTIFVDLIITDILMPGMDGFQLCRECKTNDKLRPIPFIFYTATYVSKKDEEFALGLGAEKLVIKPTDLGKLLNILEATIKESKSAAPGAPKISIKEDAGFLAEHNKRLMAKLQKKVSDLQNEIKMRKKMEEYIIKTQKLESLSTLAGGVAHDFNNFLSIILYNVTIAKSCTNPTEEIFGYLSYIEKASEGAKDLARQLGSFSKRGVPCREKISISALINELSQLVLSGSAVRCESYISDDIWQIEADKGQMKQVISNLIINAKQAMPEGGTIRVGAENIYVTVADYLPLNEGKYVKIIIEDQGIGIPDENLQKIFDPYFTTKENGNGLGLAVTYSIIKQHEGDISVESEMGVGTTFNIYLPVFLKQVGKTITL